MFFAGWVYQGVNAMPRNYKINLFTAFFRKRLIFSLLFLFIISLSGSLYGQKSANFNGDNIVNMEDYARLAADWLTDQEQDYVYIPDTSRRTPYWFDPDALYNNQ